MPIVKSYIDNTKLFHDLKAMDRNNFTYDGSKALMDYLDDMDENIEYDPIAFCCNFAEYAESEYIALSEEFSHAPKICDYSDDDESHEAHKVDLMDWLRDETTVIEFDGGIIIQHF